MTESLCNHNISTWLPEPKLQPLLERGAWPRRGQVQLIYIKVTGLERVCFKLSVSSSEQQRYQSQSLFCRMQVTCMFYTLENYFNMW